MIRTLFVLTALCLPLAAYADERILSFESDILVRADGWLEVTETIRVRAEGQQIRRGIYRDFPTRYVGRDGLDRVVDYRPLSLLRNSASEDFHSVNLDNGVRTYFGSRDRFLSNGEHTYVYRYRVNRQLGFFAEYDELYWNVTGFGWAFPIDRASATVRLEFEADQLETIAYTGPMYARGTDYRSRMQADGSVFFEATEVLSPVNGLTVVVAWPKGFVTPPTDLDRLGWLLRDNRDLVVVLGGLLALLAYYIPVWRRFGKDPDEGTIVTRYEPPEGYSPASLRYVQQMYYDNKVMTAAVVNLAVKGYLRIIHEDGVHRLEHRRPGPDAQPLAPGEAELHRALFSGGTKIELDNSNHRILGRAKAAHSQSLKADYNRKYFSGNGLLNIAPALMTVATAVVAVAMRGKTPLVILMFVLLNFAVLIFFAVIMKRPTLRGRALLDQMLGFKDYLEVAEKDELELRNPPDKTPALFEAYLPYALALDVDQQWSEKFAAVLAAAGDHEGGSQSYRPDWYQGHFNTSTLLSSRSGLTSGLNKAISSSVSPPGSSSGSGGGGFSGGGGGGGGGGGW